VALYVSDLHRSVPFYQTLLGVAPVKYKPGYAKFDIAIPPLNLTLTQKDSIQPHGVLSHLGIQVEHSEEVQAAIARFTAAGLSVVEEFNTDCCYALQDKVGVSDPDDNRWEIFVVKVADTAPDLTVDATLEPEASTPRTCCLPTCCS